MAFSPRPGFRLALAATLLALLVVMLGAYTRLTHAGLGCPDWPGCYGFMGVPQSSEQLAHAERHFPDAPVEAEKGWNEMVHRYFAGSLGLLIALLALLAVRHRGLPGQPLKLPLLLLALVLLQAAFGMWTVTLKLWPQVVSAHLLGGFATLALLCLLSLRLSGAVPTWAGGPLRTDAVVLSCGDSETTIRVVVRPSGTEPKVKCYIEVRCADVRDLSEARLRAEALATEVKRDAQRW